MAEIALVSAKKARLETQAAKGNQEAKEALQLANHPDKFLSTVQIGITLIGILTGIISGESLTDDLVIFINQWNLAAPYSKGIATTILVTIITYFTLVFGELVPKRIGLSKPETIAKLMARPMRIISQITHPFIWLLSTSTRLVVRILKIKVDSSQITEEEIKAIISEGTEHGAIEEAEQEIIERVFHLGDRTITSLMTHRSDIVWIDINDNEEKIKKIILQDPHTVYPVCEEEIDEIKGIVTIKDLYITEGLLSLKEIMKPAQFVPENITAYQVLEKLKQTHQQSCFIVDEYGTLQGMITLNNILEAIVGDMPQPNESDFEIIEREDGTFLADAQIPFYDFLEWFEKTEWMSEGEQEFDTLAGFILNELERIPKTGDKLDWKGFLFEIIDMDGQRIDKVLIKISKQIRDEMEYERQH